MGIRRRTVEHVFGTLKSWMGSTHQPRSKSEVELGLVTQMDQRVRPTLPIER